MSPTIWFFRLTNLVLIIVAANSAFAGPSALTIPLASILQQLGASPQFISIAPVIKNPGEVDSRELGKLRLRSYPVAKIAASPSGSRILLQIDSKSLPEDHPTADHMVLLRAERDTISVEANIFAGDRRNHFFDPVFLGDDKLAFTEVHRNSQSGNTSVIKILDLNKINIPDWGTLLSIPGLQNRKVREIDSRLAANLSSELSHLNIRQMRMISSQYALALIGGLEDKLAVLRIDASTMKPSLLKIFDGSEEGETPLLAYHIFMHAKGHFETGSKVTIPFTWLPDGRTDRRVFPKIFKIDGDKVQLKDDEFELRRLKSMGKGSYQMQERVQGDANLIFGIEGRTVHVESLDGQTRKEWRIDSKFQDVTLKRIHGGYLARFAEHPSYRFAFLRDDGDVETLMTDRLVAFEAQKKLLVGTTSLVGDMSVDLQIIDLSRCAGAVTAPSK